MRWVLIACATLSVSACAHGRRASDQELSRLRREVKSLQRDLAEARDQIDDLDRRLTLVNARAPAPVRAGPGAAGAPREARPSPSPAALAPRLNLPVVRVAPDASHPTGEAESDVGALDDGRPPILIKLGPSDDDDDKLPVDTTVLRRPDPVLHGKSAKDEYREALTALRERDEPERAKALFAAFERRHPESSLVDNAVYWLGEAHFALAEYTRAIACFERLEREHPRSSKLPHARLRWGESLLRAGRRELAVTRLQEVVELHPDTTAADEAARLLAGAGAKGKM